MAKVKFEAEDFKKDSNTSQKNPKPNHLQKYWKWYGGAVAAACIAGAVILWPKGEVTPPTPPAVADSLENVVDSSALATPDTIAAIAEESTSNEEKSLETGTKPVNEEQKNSETQIVNNPPVTQSGDITMDAKKAIRGDFGNGAERRKNLGANYDKVQAVVNKMYQDGNLHW